MHDDPGGACRPIAEETPLPDARMSLGPSGLDDLFPEGEAFSRSVQTYVVLLTLAALIATFGLYQDSVAAIIGAMVVAPLGGAIMAVAAALVTGRLRWQGVTLLQAALGSVWVVVIGFLVSLLIPDPLVLTPSIDARTQPGLLDLGVTIAAGAAGAYVAVRRNGTDALPGVAIAVSLVPPLATVGICLELGRIDDAAGAALLFLTNFAAIVVAATIVFILAGAVPSRELIRERRRLRAGFAAAIIALVAVTVPLAWSAIAAVEATLDEQAAAPVVRAWIGASQLEVTGYKVDGDTFELRLTGPDEPGDTASLATAIAVPVGHKVDLRGAVGPVHHPTRHGTLTAARGPGRRAEPGPAGGAAAPPRETRMRDLEAMAADVTPSTAVPAAGLATARSDPLERYEPVIGIEVHCQLRTASKMFCGCSTDYDGAPPNSHVCPVCLGLPGALPTINRRAVEHVLTTGIAIGATVPPATRWDRKNYFYPDLPKGYQISQYDLPLASHGRLTVDTSEGPVTIGIRRAHLEEDTAKLVHATMADGRRVSLVDFNRSGAPLMEVVTEPDVRSAEQARRYAEELQLTLRAIGVSDADMEHGQLRVEANVSLRPRGTETFGTRVEVKNMNSFRSVERAIAYEIERQAAALDAGEPMTQDTRGWSDERGETYVMRSKEDSHDYRYFPEPDLPPLRVDPAWLDALRVALPELPADRRRRYRDDLGLSAYDAAVLVADPTMAAAFEAIRAAGPEVAPKDIANLVAGDYGRAAKESTERTADGLVGRASAGELADLLRRVSTGELSRANSKEVLAQHLSDGTPVARIVEERGLRQISDEGALGSVADEVLAANPDAVADYRAGKPQAIGFLVGQVMKATRGQANPGLVQAALRARLDHADEG